MMLFRFDVLMWRTSNEMFDHFMEFAMCKKMPNWNVRFSNIYQPELILKRKLTNNDSPFAFQIMRKHLGIANRSELVFH